MRGRPVPEFFKDLLYRRSHKRRARGSPLDRYLTRCESAVAGAQDLPRHRIAQFAFTVEALAVDHDVFDATRRHHEPPATARQIVAHLGTLVRTDRVVVEHGDV